MSWIEKERPSWYPWLEWGLIFLGIFLFFGIGIWTDKMDKERVSQKTHRLWKDVMTEEQRREFGINDEWKPIDYTAPPGSAECFKRYIQNGGYSKEDELIDRLCEEDYHDIIDYMGGPEGF